MPYLNNYTGQRTVKAPAQDKQTNASAAAVVAASANLSHVIQALVISASAAPAAAVEVTVAYTPVDGSASTLRLQIPAAATAPIWINVVPAIVCAKNTAVTATLPALGAGVVGTITLFYDEIVAP